MMKMFVAMAIGVLLEAGLIGLLIVGGMGPCGPGSPASAFVLIIHVPGVLMIEALHISEPFSLAIVAALYAAVWSAIALLLISGLSRKNS